MSQRLFFVDIESSGPSPFSSVMTEFGVVDLESRNTFYAHLWDFHPHPDTPALPVAERENVWIEHGWNGTGATKTVLMNGHEDPATAAYEALTQWLNTTCGRDQRPVFVSDNPGFDFGWMAYGFDAAGMKNPFGFSSRRIGDLAAGLEGNWRKTSNWKRYRKTKHDHNPVNDALGNAEAFVTLLTKHNQSQ